MRRISNRDQVLGAISTRGAPMNLFEIFRSCDCFVDEKDCAALLKQMADAKQITSHRFNGERALYAMPGMPYSAPSKAVAVVAPPPRTHSAVASEAGTPPNDAELVTARHLSPVVPAHAALAAASAKVQETLTEIAAARRGRGRRPDGDGGRAKVLAAIEAEGAPISSGLIRRLTHLTHSYVNRLLTELVDDGVVVRTGASVATRYTLAHAVAGCVAPAKAPEPLAAAAAIASGHAIAAAGGASQFAPATRESVSGVPIEHEKSPFLRDLSNAQFPLAGTDRKPAQQTEVEQVLSLLRQQMTDDEYRGYLRGTLMTLALRGTPDDLQRQQYFGAALAQVLP